MAWSVAIEEEMIAVIDPNQKHYFTLHDMGLHSSTKNGYQDNGGTFDDVSSIFSVSSSCVPCRNCSLGSYRAYLFC